MREKTADPYFKIICIMIFSSKKVQSHVNINEDTEWKEYFDSKYSYYIEGLWSVFKNGETPSYFASSIAAINDDIDTSEFKRSTFYNYVNSFKVHMNYFDILRKLNAKETEVLEMMISGGALYKASVDKMDKKRYVWDTTPDMD
jgi:hypothetical protein